MATSYRGIFHIYPLVPITVMLVLGIVVGRWAYGAVSLWIMIGALLLSLAISTIFFRHPWTSTCALLAGSFAGGGVLVNIAERQSEVVLPEEEIEYKGVIVSDPVERGRTVRFDLLVADGPFCGKQLRVSLLKDTIKRRYAALDVGHAFIATSQLNAPTNFGNSNFDYPTYLKSRGIVATTFVFHSKWRSETISLQRLSIFERARIGALITRGQLMERYRQLGLDGQGMAVVSAMTLGDKSALSAETRDTYSITGASHILALSGMHLGIIYTLLSFFSLGRRFHFFREAVLLLAIWCYVFLVGMSPSVMRSALMISAYAVVSMSGRGRASLNALAFAALVMLMANPLVLYDIGFQLSFMAVAFILIFQPMIGDIVSPEYCMRHRLIAWIWQLLVMSTVAQAGTAPLVAYYFGRLPVYFLLTNLIVIPAATVILYAAVTLFALWFAPLLQHIVAKVLHYVVTLLNISLSEIATWPFSSIDDLHINELQVILLYVMMTCIFLVIRILVRRRQWIAYIRYNPKTYRRRGLHDS